MKQLQRGIIFGLFCLISSSGLFAQRDEVGHIVIGIEGDASVRLFNANDVPLSVGAILRSNDVVELDVISSVYILCADLSIDVITSTSRAPNCLETIDDPIWSWGPLRVLDIQRSRGYDGVLYIVSPRNSDLLDGNPLITWSPVEAEAEPVTYKVTMSLEDGTILWERDNIEETQLEYPTDQEFLRALDSAGNPLNYLVSVEAFDANGIRVNTRLDSTNRRSLRVLTPDERLVIDGDLYQINDLQMPLSSAEDVRNYSKALYLFSNGLYADAYELLIPLIETPLNEQIAPDDMTIGDIRHSPHLYFLLGDIHRETSLFNFARFSYERALRVAQVYGDANSEGVANVRLAELSPDEAETYYEAAISAFETAGNNDAIVQAQAALDELQ